MLPAAVAGRSKRLTNRQLLARIPKTGAAAKDLVCDRINGLPCRYAPVYDKDRLELWLCGEPILSLKKHCRQTELLEAFQFAGWPHSLTDPLGAPSALDPENGLSDIISALKGRQGSRLRVQFTCEGRSVHWEIVVVEPANQ